VSLSLKNYLYSGTIRHRRFTPFDRFFTYPLFLAYIDLETISTSLKKSWFWNINKPAIVSFYRNDYHGDKNKELASAVRETIFEKTGTKPTGPIRLLTHLRYFGYCFNPVSFYYCFDSDDKELEVIMAEVTNTPWKERHSYIIDKKSDKNKIRFVADLKKKLHVSPFWGMDHEYEWSFSSPEEKLFVNMKNFKDEAKVFDATLSLKRRPFTRSSLFKYVAKFPFITLFIVFRIHLQAFYLWSKNVPFFTHPRKIISK
jgi:DUF1365 family protein|tara:strand:+ start:4355 stop:5125 length:771 start_codon:yes stop_codon:yes gene_type:complete